MKNTSNIVLYLTTILILMVGCSKPMIKISDTPHPTNVCESNTIQNSPNLDNYFSDVTRHIWNNWIIPPEVDINNSLETIVSIRIQQDGNIEQLYIEKPSGNKQYDYFVLQAINESNPLPEIPIEFGLNCLDIGVRFTSDET